MGAPDALVRVHRTQDGAAGVGRGPGRGAWLCGPPATLDCLELAMQRGALERALRSKIVRDEVARLRAKLEHMSG